MSQHTQDREGKSRKVSETAGFIGQHTPGPFKIEQNDTEGMYLVNEAGTILCEWVHLPDDARLIAAAPELLTGLLHVRHSDHGYWPSACSGCEAAEKAIAKAQGR